MKNLFFKYLILLIMLSQNSCAQKHTNHLINETSPYLLQHAHNPVNWYPYGDEALQKAKAENKLILFSIGYAACHWCHVMEHESFENEAIAEIMNEHFICIKVDKEERPDVDQIYMNAVQILTGSGGWPLNCFALPDGRPVWGGTYFRPKDWTNILKNLASSFKSDPERFERSAKELTRGIIQSELISHKSDASILSQEELTKSIDQLKQDFDSLNGGFIGQPKFPMPGLYDMLLDYGLTTHDSDLVNHVSFTLKKWAYGGIYDQLGGGFARYSVDSKWLVPHFEKMLYDNGQILGLYAKMYRVTKEPVFKRIIKETVAWTQREMTNTDGLFYASYDADSEGEEGLFYLWDKQEVDSLLKDQSKAFCKYYGLTKNGNFEGKTILNVESMSEASPSIIESKQLLFQEREQRIKPSLDHKTLTAWNALMISGLCESYFALGEETTLNMAIKAGEAILKQRINKNGELIRLTKKNEPVKGFLEDYALSIKAFLDLHQATFDDKWLQKALDLSQKAEALFFDSTSGMYYFTALNENVIIRKMEISDHVIPASNSIMANNLYQLSILLDDSNMRQRSLQMLKNTKTQTYNTPSFSYNWINLALKIGNDEQEIVIVGEDAKNKRNHLLKDYFPLLVVTGSTTENSERPLLKQRFEKGKTLYYYCKNKTCQLPTENDEALKKYLYSQD